MTRKQKLNPMTMEDRKRTISRLYDFRLFLLFLFPPFRIVPVEHTRKNYLKHSKSKQAAKLLNNYVKAQLIIIKKKFKIKIV